jgi:hypothetical protein
MAAWFQFDAALGIAVGVVLGFIVASVILRVYGGRSTR